MAFLFDSLTNTSYLLDRPSSRLVREPSTFRRHSSSPRRRCSQKPNRSRRRVTVVQERRPPFHISSGRTGSRRTGERYLLRMAPCCPQHGESLSRYLRRRRRSDCSGVQRVPARVPQEASEDTGLHQDEHRRQSYGSSRRDEDQIGRSWSMMVP